jgi:hypothetical protein
VFVEQIRDGVRDLRVGVRDPTQGEPVRNNKRHGLGALEQAV